MNMHINKCWRQSQISCIKKFQRKIFINTVLFHYSASHLFYSISRSKITLENRADFRINNKQCSWSIHNFVQKSCIINQKAFIHTFPQKTNMHFLSFYILGGFLLRKNQAFRGSAIAPAASLASLSPVAAFGAPTILATV